MENNVFLRWKEQFRKEEPLRVNTRLQNSGDWLWPGFFLDLMAEPKSRYIPPPYQPLKSERKAFKACGCIGTFTSRIPTIVKLIKKRTL